jgi:hypothetical protein
VAQQVETFEADEVPAARQAEAGAVVHSMPDLVTVPLRDGPAHEERPAPLDLRTTQVWHRSQFEHPPAPALDVAELPEAAVPVRRATERTMLIRRPVARKPVDWHAPIGLAASAGVLAVMLALADWSESHPAHAPAGAAPEPERAALPVSQPIVVEALPAAPTDETAQRSATPQERTGRRGSKGSVFARGDAGRPATKTRVRSNGRAATPGARGGRASPPPPAKDEDSASSGSGSAMARSSARVRAGSRSTGLTSSAWVDPFASY